jgi:hypothetical protein
MTCREFMEATEDLTPSQLLQIKANDGAISVHAGECAECGKWLESRRLLSGALQGLQVQHAQREASPKVEAAVLWAFRDQGFGPASAVAPERAAPAAWKLSRYFEFGAYAAVAAALIVGVFLGTRMWRDNQAPVTQAQAQQSASSQPVTTEAKAVTASTSPSGSQPTDMAANQSQASGAGAKTVTSKRTTAVNNRVASSNTDKQGFVALMLCDPLICSGDEQVIRMELPANDNGSQPVIADVVVGDDGLVRAMRIVN